MTRGIFGWDYPPGVSKLPYDEEYPCEVCGGWPETTCICPECPVCGGVGDPACYVKKGSPEDILRTKRRQRERRKYTKIGIKITSKRRWVRNWRHGLVATEEQRFQRAMLDKEIEISGRWESFAYSQLQESLELEDGED